MPSYQYEKVADDIRALIRDGTYPPGSRLPTRAQLRAEHHVSEIVINSAMRILRAQGLVETLNGVGTYVADPLPT